MTGTAQKVKNVLIAKELIEFLRQGACVQEVTDTFVIFYVCLQYHVIRIPRAHRWTLDTYRMKQTQMYVCTLYQ